MSYDAERQMALDLISESGALVQFTRTGNVQEDPVSMRVEQQARSFLAHVVCFPEAPGRTIDVGDRKVSIKLRGYVAPAAGGPPRNGDVFTWAGDRVAVLRCDPLNPASESTEILTTIYAGNV